MFPRSRKNSMPNSEIKQSSEISKITLLYGFHFKIPHSDFE